MIGRKKELLVLESLYNSGKAEFVAIYGRRRVGKTYLVDEAMRGRITFRHAGLSPFDELGKKNQTKDQLRQFYFSLQLSGMAKSKCPSTWFDAFFMLEMWLQSKDDGSRQVVFLDELPWMDTPKSGFMTAFEGFWNNWACHRPNLMLIVCGSANSWILDNLINNHGGLYGRVTYEIRLSPFSLAECEDFFKSAGVNLSRYDIVQSNMIVGGIPYYLNCFQRGLSLSQNIDGLFFSEYPRLRDEFDRLFASIFSNPEEMKRVVRFLARRRAGFTRSELVEGLKTTDSGAFSKMLKALVASDFIISYIPFGENRRNAHYRLVDPLCIFYLKFVEGKENMDQEFWTHGQSNQSLISWRGLAFEDVCLRHVSQIKAALGIQGVSSTVSTWTNIGDGVQEGTQIDLLIMRKDNVVNLCEMKFYNDTFHVDKNYWQTMMRRQNLLSSQLPRRMAVNNVLISTFGLADGEYSGVFQNSVVLDDLFRGV